MAGVELRNFKKRQRGIQRQRRSSLADASDHIRHRNRRTEFSDSLGATASDFRQWFSDCGPFRVRLYFPRLWGSKSLSCLPTGEVHDDPCDMLWMWIDAEN